MISLVSQTINDLYFSLSIAGVRLDWASLLKGITLGILGAVVATLIPAYEATRVAPYEAMSRSELEGRSGVAVNWAAVLGLLLIAGAGVVFMLPGPQLYLGFVGMFMFILGSAMICPWITVKISAALQRLLAARRWLSFHLSARGINAAISRTGVAVAALMLAVATTIGVGVMVDSFRNSVNQWLSTVLRADYYVTLTSSPTPGAATGLTTSMLTNIRELPGVTNLSHVRRVTITSTFGVEQLAVYELTTEARKGFRLQQAPVSETLWAAFENEDVVLVSEPYAYRNQLEAGSRLRLRTDAGLREFMVAAVYQDYASDRGIVAMSRSTYNRYWSDNAVSGIGIYAAADFDPAELRSRLNDILGPEVDMTVVSNREIREESLRIFDRTFTITEVLRLLAGVIAFIGVFSALMAIQLERSRELGILKALGFTPAQIRRVIVGETALIGAAAGLLAMPVGTAMAALLIFVINRRSFGWTMSMDLDASIFASGLALALIAALLAGVYPAARMAKVQPAVALRTE